MVAMVEELVTSWLEEAPPSGAPLGGLVRSKHGRFLGLVVRGGRIRVVWVGRWKKWSLNSRFLGGLIFFWSFPRFFLMSNAPANPSDRPAWNVPFSLSGVLAVSSH